MLYINAPIGAGKTSLAKILAQDLGTKAFLEDPSKIPSLQAFYNQGKLSREMQAFVTQIEFLDYRYDQLLQGIYLQQSGMRNTVYDSSLVSDALMSLNLYKRGEFPETLYRDYLHLNMLMQTNVAGHPFTGPDLIIYLQIPFDLELKHIYSRGRAMETTDPKLEEYYRSVWETYNAWYASYGSSPTMAIDLGTYDFVNNPADRVAVLNQIEEQMFKHGLLSSDELTELKATHPAAIA